MPVSRYSTLLGLLAGMAANPQAQAAEPQATHGEPAPFASLAGMGPAMAQLIGRPCPADRWSDVGARVVCDKRGRVVMARIELDGRCTWGIARGYAPIGTLEGLRQFAAGAWAPSSGIRRARSDGKRPHGIRTYKQGPLLWRAKTCPMCRRAYVIVNVGLATSMVGTDGKRIAPLDAPDRRRSRRLARAQRAYKKSQRRGTSLLRHRDSLVRAMALTVRPAHAPIEDALLGELLTDSDLAVRRLARSRLFHEPFSQRRVPHLRAALSRAYPIELGFILSALAEQPLWLADSSIRAAVREVATHYPDPLNRGEAKQLLGRK